MTGGTMEHLKTNRIRWNVKSVEQCVQQVPHLKIIWRKNMAGFLSSVASPAVALTSMSFNACRSTSSLVIRVLRKRLKKKVTAV